MYQTFCIVTQTSMLSTSWRGAVPTTNPLLLDRERGPGQYSLPINLNFCCCDWPMQGSVDHGNPVREVWSTWWAWNRSRVPNKQPFHLQTLLFSSPEETTLGSSQDPLSWFLPGYSSQYGVMKNLGVPNSVLLTVGTPVMLEYSCSPY